MTVDEMQWIAWLTLAIANVIGSCTWSAQSDLNDTVIREIKDINTRLDK